MLIFSFGFFKNRMLAGIMVILMAIFTASALIPAIVLWGMDTYKKLTYVEVTGVVTDFNERWDGKDNWTDITYKYDGQEYTVHLKGHSSWMTLNSEHQLLCNPSSPEIAEELQNMGILSSILLKISLLPGAFFLACLINYIIVVRKSKKNVAGAV